MSDYNIKRQLSELQQLADADEVSPAEYEQERMHLIGSGLRERAREAYSSGDASLAKTLLAQGAAAHHAKSALALGEIAEEEENVTEARHWYERAVELGDLGESALLGEVLWRRLGDRASGERILQTACDQGEPNAIETLALLQCQAGEISEDDLGARWLAAARLRLPQEVARSRVGTGPRPLDA